MCPGLGLEGSGSLGFMTVGVVLPRSRPEVRPIYVELQSMWNNDFLTVVKRFEPLIYALVRSRTANPKPYHHHHHHQHHHDHHHSFGSGVRTCNEPR